MKTLETCNRKMLDQVYSEEEILELIKLDSILDFDKHLENLTLHIDLELFLIMIQKRTQSGKELINF